MRISDLEPFCIYEGPNKQRRELVSVDGYLVEYRMIDRGTDPNEGRGAVKPTAEVGELRETRIRHFFNWAQREVA